MNVFAPKLFDSFLSNDENSLTLANMHDNARNFYLENIDIKPEPEDIVDALECIEEHLDITLNKEQLEEILSLFPNTRIEFAYYEGPQNDTSVRQSLIDAVCVFCTGFEFPRYKDNIDIEKFISYLHSKAKELGYKIHTAEPE